MRCKRLNRREVNHGAALSDFQSLVNYFGKRVRVRQAAPVHGKRYVLPSVPRIV